MIKLGGIFFFLLLSLGDLISRDFSIIPYIHYNTALTQQPIPDYFSSEFDWMFELSRDYDSDVFSLANGYTYGASIRIVPNNTIGFDLGLDYFNSKEQTKYTKYSGHNEINFTTRIVEDWSLHSLNLKPKLVLKEEFNKFNVVIKSGVILGYTKMNMINTIDEYKAYYEFDWNWSYGYLLGADVGYALKTKLSIAAEFGIENQFYTPKASHLVDFINYPQDAKTYQLEFVYVDEWIDGDYHENTSEPTKSLTKTIQLYSLYFGISLKYDL